MFYTENTLGFFRAQEAKAPVTYCDHGLSGVRSSVVCPSSVRQITFSTSPEPLDVLMKLSIDEVLKVPYKLLLAGPK